MPDSPQPSLPSPEQAREWLQTMTLIRRFEERAGEMYARAKIGGFLHLSIGEEATIVGSARALREDLAQLEAEEFLARWSTVD